MGVIYEQSPYKVYQNHPCFYCGDAVSIGVVWHGVTGVAVLHETCAVDLWVRLARDLWELQCRRGEVR